MEVLDQIGQGLWNAFQMAWEVWWALVLGFLLSGVVQAWVPRSRMETALGGRDAKSVALASGLGAASSSCSYAAVAIAKSIFQKGASLVSAMVFQFASTNLVFEIGIVMWLFLGWEFTLAEFVGGLILSLDAWSDVAHNFRGDWEMLWKEITAGFLIAGFVALLPMDFFNALFLTDTGGWVQLLENVIVGPIVAVLSFVCSVGNVPLAAVLWAGGISFSGVIAFIYADLIIIPLVLVYGRYYGWRVATLLVSIMFAAIVAAALAVDGLFSAFGLIPDTRPSIESITERGISWNYTTVLNIVFTAVAAGLIGLTLRRAARDPVCGMTVDRGKAVTIEHRGKTYFFCGPGCRSKFEADPERFVAREASAMRADPAARH
jgi:uncharacterized membrane protein YraQ (UPF0718 family)/YHS domain-containing protein